MNNMSKLEVSGSNPASKDIKAEAEHGQTVVVLQGGGALGAYQAGVYQGLRDRKSVV